MPVLRRSTRRWFLYWLMGVAAFVSGVTVLPGQARAQDGPSSFAGSSDGFGLNLTVTIPGAPITNSPVDSGGPTAQAALNSFGNSTGYAAFPDPGQTVVSLPGLLQGLLSTGLGSLPPVNTPPLPAYPFFVQSEGGTTPTAQMGAGPYVLRATSTDSSSDASATGGLQGSPVGNAALVTSQATVSEQSDGGVIAQATSDIQGLTVGPLVLGEVLSTATETVGSDGTVRPSTNLVITGVRIGGLPVALSTAGLNLVGIDVPLPVNPVLQKALATFHLTATLLAAQTYHGEVIGPAVQLSGPVNDLGLGTGPGTFSLTLGGTEAAMEVGAAFPTTAAPGSPATHQSASSSSGPSAGASVPSGAEATPVAAGSTASLGPTTAAVPGSAAPTGGSLAPLSTASPVSGRRSLALVSNPLGFDIRSLYLVFGAAALVAVLAAQLVRTLGVREPWTSSRG